MASAAAFQPSERQVQRSILAMCGLCFPRVFITAVPNGAYLGGRPSERARQMGCLKGDGLKTGYPDLIIHWPTGKGACIEVKRPGGRLSDDQKTVHAKLAAIGWPVATCESVDEAFRFLRECGAPWSGAELMA